MNSGLMGFRICSSYVRGTFSPAESPSACWADHLSGSLVAQWTRKH